MKQGDEDNTKDVYDVMGSRPIIKIFKIVTCDHPDINKHQEQQINHNFMHNCIYLFIYVLTYLFTLILSRTAKASEIENIFFTSVLAKTGNSLGQQKHMLHTKQNEHTNEQAEVIAKEKALTSYLFLIYQNQACFKMSCFWWIWTCSLTCDVIKYILKAGGLWSPIL